MPEVLSNEEIEQLLNAINSFPEEDEVVNNENHTTEKENPDVVKFCIYDFKRPVKFSSISINTLQEVFTNFSHYASVSFSESLQEVVELSLASVSPLLYNEFTRSVPNPTFCIVANIGLGLGEIIFEIDPGLSLVIIDSLTGGNGSCRIALKESSDIELELMKESSLILLECFRESFKNIITINPSFSRIEFDPSNIRVVSENEMCLLFTFTAKIVDFEGILNICIPYKSLEPIVKKFDSNNYHRINSVCELNKISENSLSFSSIQRSVLLSSSFLNVSLSDFEKWQVSKIVNSNSKDFLFTYECIEKSNGGE